MLSAVERAIARTRGSLHGGPRVESRFFRGDHGMRLHARVAGSSGVPIVFLHGYGLSASVWEDAIVHLVSEGDRRCIALDFRGHGDSDWDDERRYSRTSLVDDVVAALDAFDVQRCVLVGHSLGGDVAFRFWSAHRDRVAALALVDVGPELRPRGLRIIREWAFRVPDVFTSRAEYFGWLQAIHPFGNVRMLHALVRDGLEANGDGTLRRKLDPSFRDVLWNDGVAPTPERSAELWAALADVEPPTLVIRGAASAVLARATAVRMQRELARGHLEVVPRAGHSVMVDNPRDTVRALARFLDNV